MHTDTDLHIRQRRPASIITLSGAVIPMDRRTARAEQDISILDIAHSLALTNRFNGHTVRPLSVAEHSLLVVEIAERELGLREPGALLAALLHDAHEAITGDLITPAKWELGPAWSEFERMHQHQVLERFGALQAASIWRSAISYCDELARATESRDLRPGDPRDTRAPTVQWINLRDRDGMGWQDWRQAFLDQFEALRARCGTPAGTETAGA